jgi:hypothetical protein
MIIELFTGLLQCGSYKPVTQPDAVLSHPADSIPQQNCLAFPFYADHDAERAGERQPVQSGNTALSAHLSCPTRQSRRAAGVY